MTKPYYLTKYTLSNKGVITQFEPRNPVSEGYVYDANRWTSFKVGRDAHETKEGALVAAESARIKRIESLEKKIKTLASMSFSFAEAA